MDKNVPGCSKSLEKMESEQSYSGDSSSTSDSTTDSSEGDEELMEPVRIMGHTLELPQELCEDFGVFKEFFSMKTWDSLNDEHKTHLKQYLPTFPDNDEEEKEKTIKMLFNFEPFHFTSPLSDFFNNLRQGNFRPDIAKMRTFLMKTRVRQHKHKMKAYYADLLPEVLISRERLLVIAKGLPPGAIPSLLPLLPKPKNNYTPIYTRAKQRYFEELASIHKVLGAEESDDDNYPEGPPELFLKKRKQLTAGQSIDITIAGTLSICEPSSSRTSLECLKNVLVVHRARRQYRENHPELNTTGITLEDIKQRVTLVNGAKKLMFGGPKNELSIQKLKRGPKKEPRQPKKKDEEHETVENKPLLPNIKIKMEREESDSESSSFVDPMASPNQGKRTFENVDIKEEVIDPKYPDPANTICNEPDLNCVIKQEPPDQLTASNRLIQHVPIKLEDLDGIDMMALPVEIADESGSLLPGEDDEEEWSEEEAALGQTTYASFLSLVRALFPARAAHRASRRQLHARCRAAINSNIAPLNTWYTMSEDWCAELDSALSFLAGERGPHPEDFVPYLQYMPDTQMYQWIGAGRDCDSLLARLYERWHRAPPTPRLLTPKQEHSSTDVPENHSGYPTPWVVRPPTTAEIADFHIQERKRFAAASKSFTYIHFGYRAVVGPCVRSTAGLLSGGGGSCSGHAALVVGDRPRHASFLTLLRDAVARLPNGQGTRHDVLTLLKMSQWIAPCSEQTLLSAVTSALDRLHSAKREPMIKYDEKTSVWTYLFRHRSEDDWAKSISNRGRTKGAVSPAPATVPALPAPAPAPAPPPPALPEPPPDPHAMEVASVEEVVDNGSDTDVDVDDSGSPTAGPQLSSAQLLMQATLTQKLSHAPPKNKGKLVPVSSNKTKTSKPPQPKQTIPPPKQTISPPKPTSLLTPPAKAPLQTKVSVITSTSKAAPTKQPNVQAPVKPTPQTKQTPNTASPKQTSLMTQAAKQASVIAQLTKLNVSKPSVIQSKQVSVVKQTPSPKQTTPKQTTPKQITQKSVAQTSKQALVRPAAQEVPKQEALKVNPVKQTTSIATVPHKSTLIKQRPLIKQNDATAAVSAASILVQQAMQATAAASNINAAGSGANLNKMVQGTRSLLIRAPAAAAAAAAVQTTATAAGSGTSAQTISSQRRGIVRVLSPATPSGGKSLISPRALMQQAPQANKKRSVHEAPSVTTVAQKVAATTLVSSVPTAVTSSVSVQMSGGRTMPVQLGPGVGTLGGVGTVQLSPLVVGGVRLPSGHTVQIATSSGALRASSPRPHSSPTLKTPTSLQIPMSSVQLAPHTVQIAGQTVQIAGQSVQLTGHTVKLPSGQSVQVASPSVIQSQSVQLPSGQTVQLGGGVQTVQLGQNVLTNQVSAGHVQLSGQTVQLATGQTVQLPSGQTLQLAGGQTVQLSTGQTIQLASGQTVQLANQQHKPVARSQNIGEKTTQPIVAKLLTNAQGQMLSLESGSGSRSLQVSGVRVLSPARGPRPLLLTAAKPLHNMILQQSDGSTLRVTSTGGASTSQAIVLSNLGAQTATTTTTPAPVLKLQQVNPLQQVKLPQGIKLQQAVSSNTGMRGVVMETQQLKLVGGRHVLARILRPAPPAQPPAPHPPQHPH